jgi:sterol desaturase/sphingolipid hydroxylase (fatty acid hydroxylase superfamily)
MNHWIIKYELYVRFVFFVLVFSGLAFWAYRSSWRKNLLNLRERWQTHLSLAALSTFLVRLSFPLLTLGMAASAEHQHLGILNTAGHLPFWAKVAIGVIGMDFAMYMEHRWMHRYQVLWRVHRVHHTDTELDLTTGLRFHPIESFFMVGMKILAIFFLGPPVIAVLIYELLLTSLTLFNHSNIRLGPKIEPYLRWFFVTPTMHRIHHSDIPFEHNHNFGFCFSVWDKILNTYLPNPHQGEHNLVFGLELYRSQTFQTFQKLLVLPFLKIKTVKNRFAHIR